MADQRITMRFSEVDPGSANNRFAALPAPIRIADTVESAETVPVPDPTMGRDTEREFMLHNMGFYAP